MAIRTRSEGFALRWTAEESLEIRRRADEAGMAVGPYLIAAALGSVTTPSMTDRLDDLGCRLIMLEAEVAEMRRGRIRKGPRFREGPILPGVSY